MKITTDYFDLPAVKLAKENPDMDLEFSKREFDSRDEAEKFAAAAETNRAIARGTVALGHEPAKFTETTTERRRVIEGSSLKTMARAIEGGDPIAQSAIDWAMGSVWSDSGSIEAMIPCLEADLADGDINGAASAAQAKKFLKRLKAAVRYETVLETETVNVPEKWVVRYMRNINYGPDVAGPWAKH